MWKGGPPKDSAKRRRRKMKKYYLLQIALLFFLSGCALRVYDTRTGFQGAGIGVPIHVMHLIIPMGFMMDIITGMATGIIPLRQVVIIGVPATLGIIDKVWPGLFIYSSKSSILILKRLQGI
jgi:hypothetical protein